MGIFTGSLEIHFPSGSLMHGFPSVRGTSSVANHSWPFSFCALQYLPGEILYFLGTIPSEKNPGEHFNRRLPNSPGVPVPLTHHQLGI